ncbi:MAG TPA: hypothetical protein VFR70_05220 [Flavobacterium sp.]|nr:hypothetical protein [Flavobacterium sp.]
MKSFIIIATIFIISCSQYKKSLGNKNTELYRISRLDSINSYYLIYATKKDSTYKIVSKKSYAKNCSEIKIGSDYQLHLKSMRDNAPTINGIRMSPINYLDIKCYQFDETTQICKEDGIYDLYFTDDIKGKCLVTRR